MFKMFFLRLVSKLVIILLHLVSFILLYFFFIPIAQWYLTRSPALGVDLYFSITYLSYQLRHLSLPFNSFKDIWFSGYPLIRDYPQLTYYLMLPFTLFNNIPIAVQTYAIASLLLLAIFSYLLFFQLSKNFGLSLFLAVLILLTPNMYGSLIWAGSIPYFSSQAIFPLVLFFGAKFLEKPQINYLAAGALFTGLEILMNALGALAFTIPCFLIIILVGGLTQLLRLKLIAKYFFFYILSSILAAFTFTYDYVQTAILQFSVPISISVGQSQASGGGQISEGARAIAQFYKNQIALLYTGTNWWIFVMLGIGLALFLFALVFAKNRLKALNILPFFLIAGYCAAHPAANLSGTFSFLRHDTYRAFWPFPIALAALAAYFWGFFFNSIKQRLEIFNKKLVLGVSFFVLLLTFIFFVIFSYSIFHIQIDGLLAKLEKNSELSSAFPEALSIRLDNGYLEKVKKQVVPSFMNPNDKNFRLYSADATVNIWWNSFFAMPLERGYVDPPIGTQNRGYFFWLDIAIANDSLVRDFKASENVALNNSLFLIDWYGVKYFEGGRLSSKGPSPGPSSYLVKNNVFDKEKEVTTYGAVLKYQTASGKPELVKDLPQKLHFYKVDDKYTTPILYPTNTPAILVFDFLYDYEDIMRMLAFANIHSRKLIPIYGGEYIDQISLRELSNFDAVVVSSNYKYKNKKRVFETLEKYVSGGGKVYIDTGSEVAESQQANLPNIFPMSKLERRGYGKSWRLEKTSDLITEDVDTKNFGPLIFNNDEWKLSVVEDDTDLRPNSKVLLRHQGKPILIQRKFGQGQVVWSGINLSYHYNQYKSDDEARLFINILKQFADLSEKEILPADTRWEKPEKVTIKAQKSRGVLFKEQGYQGWRAKAKSFGDKTLPIYLVGPTYPGFMYVATSDLPKGPMEIVFQYQGIIVYWIAALINLLAVLLLFGLIIDNGKITGLIFGKIFDKTQKKIASWWNKEEG